MLVPYEDSRWQTVRKVADKRLAEMMVRACYKDPFFLFVANVGKMFHPSYEKLYPNVMNYSGQYALVMLGKDDDLFLAKLKSTNSDDLYTAYEVPMAFTRLPVRTLIINVSSIMCIMKPCFNK
jgi:hypothetical protein